MELTPYLTHSKIEDAMRKAISSMESLTQDFSRICDEKGEAEAAYKKAFAKARVTERMHADVDGRKITNDMADDFAQVATSDELRRYKALEAKHDSTRQALNTVRAQLEAFRSLLASHRE